MVYMQAGVGARPRQGRGAGPPLVLALMLAGMMAATDSLMLGEDFLKGSGSSYKLLESFLDEQYETCAMSSGIDKVLPPEVTGLPFTFRYSSTCMLLFLQRWETSFMGSTFSSIYPTLGGKFYKCNANRSSHDRTLTPGETGLPKPFHFSSACMKKFATLYRNVTGIMARNNITEYDAHYIKGGEKLIIWLANSRDDEYFSCEKNDTLDRVLYCNVTHNTWPFYYSSRCMREFLQRKHSEVLAYRVVSVSVTTVFAFLLLVGVLGNLSLIYMCVAIPELRTSANMYVVSLAMSDMFLTTLYTPFIASLYSDYVTLWGPAYRLGKVVEEVAILASAWTLVAMSLERFVSLRRSARMGPAVAPGTPLRRGLKILAVWLAAGVLAVPTVVRALLHSQRCYTQDAAPDDVFDALVEFWDFLVSYALPLALIAACYCSTARMLYRSAAAIPGEQRARQAARRRGSARMVMSLVLLFVAFYSPQYLLNLYGLVHLAVRGEWLHDSSVAFGVLVDTAQFIRVVHSCIMPLLLYCTVARFRKCGRRSLRRLATLLRLGVRRLPGTSEERPRSSTLTRSAK